MSQAKKDEKRIIELLNDPKENPCLTCSPIYALEVGCQNCNKLKNKIFGSENIIIILDCTNEKVQVIRTS